MDADVSDAIRKRAANFAARLSNDIGISLDTSDLLFAIRGRLLRDDKVGSRRMTVIVGPYVSNFDSCPSDLCECCGDDGEDGATSTSAAAAITSLMGDSLK
jgi:hypothetical protein